MNRLVVVMVLAVIAVSCCRTVLESEAAGLGDGRRLRQKCISFGIRELIFLAVPLSVHRLVCRLGAQNEQKQSPQVYVPMP